MTLLASDGTTNWAKFTAKSAGTYGNSLFIDIAKNAGDLYDITVSQTITAYSGSSSVNVLETFYNLDLATYGNTEITNVFTLRSQFIDFSWEVAGAEKTVAASFSTLPLVSGTDGSTGDYNYGTPLTDLANIDRTFVLFSPGATSTTVTDAMIAFAESTGSFVVLDTPASITPAAAVTYAETLGTTNHAAVYYPHLWVPDTTSRSRDAVRLVSPSGAVAGAYLSTDASVGVFKAPAGTNTLLPGVVAVERSLTPTNLDALNNDMTPVNAIRVVAGVGTVIMGSRTLDQSTATKYVNIRRSLLFLERELRRNLEFAVFENNNRVLWSRMSTAASVLLQNFWNAGGLRGATQAQAFYVKIDNENNTASDIANGVVHVSIGVALQYPAEFIQINLTQQTAA